MHIKWIWNLHELLDAKHRTAWDCYCWELHGSLASNFWYLWLATVQQGHHVHRIIPQHASHLQCVNFTYIIGFYGFTYRWVLLLLHTVHFPSHWSQRSCKQTIGNLEARPGNVRSLWLSSAAPRHWTSLFNEMAFVWNSKQETDLASTVEAKTTGWGFLTGAICLGGGEISLNWASFCCSAVQWSCSSAKVTEIQFANVQVKDSCHSFSSSDAHWKRSKMRPHWGLSLHPFRLETCDVECTTIYTCKTYQVYPS